MKNSIVTDRFLHYTTFDTQAKEGVDNIPSSEGQWVFARYLEQELKQIGLSDVQISENCYLYALIKANTNKSVPKIGFIAHLDTSPAVSGKDVKAHIEKDKSGAEIIKTDGTTLLGGDDKAGVAAIVSAAEYFIQHPEEKHGDIYLAFTPDEEVGKGADLFDLSIFKADYAYTVDGGELGELEFENFNAAKADIVINGKNVHPGYAKGKMKNSIMIASRIIEALAGEGLPEDTSDYKGFFHLDSMSGNVERTELHYIIRDFDIEAYEKKKTYLQFLINTINERVGVGTVELDMKDQYRNMKEIIDQYPYIVQIAKDAMEDIGIEPLVRPIRGGTDGARLSFMGLPCPNLFAGGINFHSRDEYLPVKSLEMAEKTVISVIKTTLTSFDE